MSSRLAIPGSAYLLFLLLVGWAVAAHLRAGPNVVLTYTLDDPYIHLAIAKSLVERGVFGFASGGFTSASSSPLWVLLLAVARLFGAVSDLVPLGLNLVAAALLLFVADQVLREFVVGWPWRLVAAFLIVLHVPLVPVALTGMEHVAHASVSLAFVYAAARMAGGSGTRRHVVGLIVLAPVVAGLRYEGLFAVGAVALLLIVRRHTVLAFATIGAGVAPALVFGFVMTGHGAQPLPNPLLLKPDMPELQSPIAVLRHLTRGPAVLSDQRHLARICYVIVPLLAMRSFRYRPKPWGAVEYFALTTLLVAIMHATFARFGWFYRYEAYLMVHAIVAGFGVLAGGGLLGWARSTKRFRVALAACLVASGVYIADGSIQRGAKALRRTPIAMNEIYSQQRQMARFLHDHYPGASVAINDIGAISLFSDVAFVDLFGLGNDEVLRAKLSGEYDADRIDQIVARRGAGIAMVYRHWFEESSLPSQWIEIARWHIPTRVTVSSSSVSIFATSLGEVAGVEAALDSFEPTLPKWVSTERL